MTKIHVDKATEEQLATVCARKLEGKIHYSSRSTKLHPTELLRLGKWKPYLYDSQAAELIRVFQVSFGPLRTNRGTMRGWEASVDEETWYFTYDPNKPWQAICKAVAAGKDGFTEL